MEHIYHKQVGKAELSYSRCFLVDDCAFFSSRYYSWEVGKERCKLRVMGSTRCLAQSLHRPLLPSEVNYLLKKFLRSFQCRCGFDHWTESRCLSSLDIGKQKTNGKIQSVQCSEWGLKFCWLKHPDTHLTPKINKQRFKWDGHFYGSWFKVSRSQGFFNFHSLNRFSAPRSSGLLYNLMSFDVIS